MPVAPDVQSLNTAAERAASIGDYATAEQLLRMAADLLDAADSSPAELANTLNNLGVVSERLGKPVEAEQSYRRAFAMATEVLAPDHPFVALSETNLRDFCEARNIPFEPAKVAPPPVVEESADVPAADAPLDLAPVDVVADLPVAELRDEPPSSVAFTMPSQVEARPTPRTRATAGLVIGGLAVAAAAFLMIRSRGTERPAPQNQPAAPPVSTAPATVNPQPSPRDVSPPPPSGPVASAPRAVEASPPAPAPAAEAPARSATPAAAPVVLTATLCRTLATGAGEWQCESAGDTMSPGPVFFYTRVASPVDAAIEHRWYRDGRLHQAIPLRVRASVKSGYRTYSRATIGPDRAGEWRVELRTSDGTVLGEERFTVSP